jgi:hypothetical protein
MLGRHEASKLSSMKVRKEKEHVWELVDKQTQSSTNHRMF